MIITDLVRTSYVKRWHIVDVTKEQSVAEHSALVAYISSYLIQQTPEVPQENMIGAMWWSLYHDVPEVILGDPPGNLKLTPGFKEVYDSLTEHYAPGIAKMEVPEPARQAVKIADLIESIRFIRRYGVGPEAGYIENDIYGRLAEFAKSTVFVDTWHKVYEDVMFGVPTIANVQIIAPEDETIQ